MTKEEARTILYGYVKACREDDMLTLETFGYEDVMEAMSMGAKALQQPSLPSYVEEAAENSWVDYEYREDPRGLYSSCYIDGFIAGFEWQKQKMMEGAVEGKVFMSFAPGHNQMVMADVDLPTNTKVKVIIVKEDGE